MTLTLSEAQAVQSMRLTLEHKRIINRDAVAIAALVALYYQRRVNVEDPRSIETWLSVVVPRLIRTSDIGAEKSRVFFEALHALETGQNDYRAAASTGMVDPGVRKSLLTVGPYDYTNKASQIRELDVDPEQKQALLVEAKRQTTKKVAAAAVRHAQAGSRQTIHDNAARDRVALGWVRVTRADPCAFCAMLASRGIHYRAFDEDSFLDSDARFTGVGDAKVHDQCGCSLKPVFSENDPALERNQIFQDYWERWGTGGGDAALRFRRGYDHLQKTGEFLSWDDANEGLRAA